LNAGINPAASGTTFYNANPHWFPVAQCKDRRSAHTSKILNWLHRSINVSDKDRGRILKGADQYSTPGDNT